MNIHRMNSVLIFKNICFAILVSVALLFLSAHPLATPTVNAATNYACNDVKADLWFGNDESGSVSSSEFNDALDFMYQISDSFEYDSVTGVQAGAFAWDTSTNDIIVPITEDFADTDDTGLIQDTNVVVDGDSKGIRELYSSKAGGGGTNLTVATQHMADLVDAGNGRRSDVPQIGIILTDASEGQLTGDAANWITAGDNLRAAGDGGVGIVLVLIAEAATAYTAGSAGPTVDAVAGTGGLIVTVPTYTEAADPAEGHVDSVTEAICDTIETIAPTPVAPINDNDNISTDEEDSGPNNGDGNNDGVKDSEQTSVTTAVNNILGAYTTTETSGDCTQITDVSFYEESSLAATDPSYDYDLGLHGFTVDCSSTGGTVDVTYYWDKVYDTDDWNYRKFNASTNTFLDFNDQVTYGTAVLGASTVTTVSYSVTDGGEFDGDGVANGSILDPIGPSEASISAPNTGFSQTTNITLYALIGAGLALSTVGLYGYKKNKR